MGGDVHYLNSRYLSYNNYFSLSPLSHCLFVDYLTDILKVAFDFAVLLKQKLEAGVKD